MRQSACRHDQACLQDGQPSGSMKKAPGHIARKVEEIIRATPVIDIHTHLYAPPFGELLLWGIDELLVYHYLVAEAFRYSSIPYDEFWKLPKSKQAEIVWNTLFIEHSPVSESCRGVITTLNRLGIEPKKRDLPALRKWFQKWNVEDYTARCMELSNVQSFCMTNSPFDHVEKPVWESGWKPDDRFKAALRVDPLLLSWEDSGPKLVKWGYKVKPELGVKSFAEVRRFLADWTHRMNPEFVMVSLPPDFVYPGDATAAQLIEKAVLPHCREFNLPFAVMPGVKRAVNPSLRLAGDGVGLTDLRALQNLCAANPKTKFLCTVLARENQHELCVLARKFRNLHIFGCWWFTNIPTLIDEMTRMRLELLGTSFTAQHSDARVLDQIIYKWDHSKQVIGRVLSEKYEALSVSGWEVTTREIERDVLALFGGAYREFARLSL